jgi:hypothetical protein
MYSCDDTRCRVGCPIRISTDQRLLAAPRGFSQRATSFIASWCQGIHRMPFLYSIARTRSRGSVPHHAQKPSSETPEDDPGNLRVFRTQHDPPRPVSPRSLARSWITGSDRIVHNASEPSPSDRWGHPSLRTVSRSDTRPNDGSVDQSEDRSLLTRAQRRTRT